MKVLDLKAISERGGGEMTAIATFDLEVGGNVRVYGMRLLRGRDGQHITYAPTAIGGRRSVTFARSTAEAITAAALTIFQGAVTADANTRQPS